MSPRPLFLVIVFIALCTGIACGSKSESGGTTVPSSVTEVHPCDTSAPDPFGVVASQLQATAQAAATRIASGETPVVGSAASLTGLEGCDGPNFSQRCPLWANLEYDSGSGIDIGCGSTIGQCGCAMTSAASLLVRYGVTRGPDGQPTNPATLNEWFKADTRETESGPLSRGYVYGAVNWLAVAEYSRQAADQFGSTSLVFSGNLPGNLDELKGELDNGRPVILEQPGHYILATGESAESVTIADPYYGERTGLDTEAYRNAFVSGRLYRPGSDLSAILVAAPTGTRIAVRDSQGATVGYKEGSQQPVTEVRQSQFGLESAWRDPTCTASPPRTDFGVGMATLLLPPGAHYGIDVQGTPNGSFSFAVYSYDQSGGLVLQHFDGTLPVSGEAHYDLDYNPAPGSPQTVTRLPDEETPSPAPGMATATAPVTTATVEPTSPVDTLTPTLTPTATETPTPSPTPTATPGPAASIALQLYPFPTFCDGTTEVTAVAFPTDANGKIPMTTQVDFSVSRGVVSPPTLSTSIGRAEVKVYPGPNPGNQSVVITVTATVHGTAISTSGTFTCPGPTIL